MAASSSCGRGLTARSPVALWVTQLPGHRAVSAWPWGPSSTTLSYDSPRQAARAQEGERPVGAEMDLQVIGCDRGQPREGAQETKRTHCVNTSPPRQLDSAGLTPLIQCPGSVRFASLCVFLCIPSTERHHRISTTSFFHSCHRRAGKKKLSPEQGSRRPDIQRLELLSACVHDDCGLNNN